MESKNMFYNRNEKFFQSCFGSFGNGEIYCPVNMHTMQPIKYSAIKPNKYIQIPTYKADIGSNFIVIKNIIASIIRLIIFITASIITLVSNLVSCYKISNFFDFCKSIFNIQSIYKQDPDISVRKKRMV